MSEQNIQQINNLEFPRDKIIECAYIKFHSLPSNTKEVKEVEEVEEVEEVKEVKEAPYKFQLFDDPNIKFGTLTIEMGNTPMLTQPQVIDNDIDISGSMSNYCLDGQTKIHHAKHVLKNIATFLASTPNTNISLAVHGFDNVVDEIFSDTKLTEDNVDKLRTIIDKKLQPRNGTNIYNALEKSKQRIESRHQQNPRQKQIKMLLTDGLANEGITDYNKMAEQLSEHASTILIGFGSDHDAVGLQKLAAAQPGGAYYYVDVIEKAGLVFGEIIHGIIYEALTDVTIEVENGEIYDFVTNKWSSKLQIHSIVSEAKKTYHLRSTTPELLSASITALSAVHEDEIKYVFEDDLTAMPDLMTLVKEETEEAVEEYSQDYTDLTRYMHRQRTQELLFDIHQISIGGEGISEGISEIGGQKEIYENIKKFATYLQNYMEENKLQEDDFYKTLYADIYITKQTFGSARAAMYSGARQVSQGRERSYNITQIDASDQPRQRPRLHRHNHLRRQQAFTFEDDEEDDAPPPALMMPSLSRTNTSARQASLMRQCSAGTTCRDLDEYIVVPNTTPPQLLRNNYINETLPEAK